MQYIEIFCWYLFRNTKETEDLAKKNIFRLTFYDSLYKYLNIESDQN